MKRHAAHGTRWLQWALAASIVLGIGWGVYHTLTARPQDTLYITIGELRSRAAEAQVLAENAAAERLTATYVRAQSGQIRTAIASLRDDLGKARTRGAPPGADRAYALAEQLLRLTEALVQGSASPAASRALQDDFAALVAALIPLERAARPG